MNDMVFVFVRNGGIYFPDNYAHHIMSPSSLVVLHMSNHANRS